ncbi:MAG: hypothetical protein IT500_16235 [Rubrivivax sp.]|nr:hypothetical protein [Rubrivivax sp.]
MKPQIVLSMALDRGQTERLLALQTMFAAACNHLAPLVQETRCWNRVALHHMAYRQLRERFPALGSQMACNVIYSVSRTCRALFQDRGSPYALHKLGQAPLPRVLFLPQSPVYFDRHTLSLKDGRVSMFTLDGRMRFQLRLDEREEAWFRRSRLREVVLSREGPRMSLAFTFDEASAATGASTADTADIPNSDMGPDPDAPPVTADLPDYVMIVDAASVPEPASAAASASARMSPSSTPSSRAAAPIR